VNLPMVCTCGDENRAEGDALYQRVKEGLSQGSEELIPREISDRSFVDDLITSLLWDYGANVKYIVGDQWFGVGVEYTSPDGDPERYVSLQCDSPTLGLASIWEWFRAGKPE
jgi:hypothetical protein